MKVPQTYINAALISMLDVGGVVREEEHSSSTTN